MGEIITAFGIDIKLILIQMLNFGLLLVALWYFLYTPILNILNERQKKIEKGVKDAEAAGKAHEVADIEKAEILSGANKEAEKVVLRSKTHATEKGEQIISEADAKAENILQDAKLKGIELQNRARKASEDEIAKLAILAAEKVLQEKTS